MKIIPIYIKLVRDLIPLIIKSTGNQCRTRILDEEEYIKELRIKLKEESEEYFTSQRLEVVEELADMLEVIRALAKVHGATWEHLEEIRKKKEETSGGFQKRVYLIDVDTTLNVKLNTEL